MSITFAQVKAKLADDERKRQARLEKRRGYDKAGRERRALARALAEGGLQDLPALVAAAVEQAPAPATPEPPKPVDATVPELVVRLEAIKDRIFRLRAVFAVSLSWDCVIEANKYLTIFQDLAAELKLKDEKAFDQIVSGHEATLLSPILPDRRTVPIEVQRAVELRWEVSQAPARRAPTPPAVPDGLGWLVG
jgi:hypothetical protein